MSDKILNEILQELKDIKKTQKTMASDIKSIKLNIDRGIYEDLERIKSEYLF